MALQMGKGDWRLSGNDKRTVETDARGEVEDCRLVVKRSVGKEKGLIPSSDATGVPRAHSRGHVVGVRESTAASAPSVGRFSSQRRGRRSSPSSWSVRQATRSRRERPWLPGRVSTGLLSRAGAVRQLCWAFPIVRIYCYWASFVTTEIFGDRDCREWREVRSPQYTGTRQRTYTGCCIELVLFFFQIGTFGVKTLSCV